MQLYIVLAQNDVTMKALRAGLEALGEARGEGLPPVLPLVWPHDPRMDVSLALQGYETLTRSLDALIAEHLKRAEGVAVLIDSIDPDALDAAAEEVSWDWLVAMLILTFPEVHWIFGGITAPSRLKGDRAVRWEQIQREHSLERLLQSARRCPLFDPTGLRDWVRATTNRTLLAIDERPVVERALNAAAIDEERPYAFLHGYTAYRHGFRTDVVTSWAVMEALFGTGAASHDYTLLFEDLSLKFPDRPRGIELLDLSERAKFLPRLDAMRQDGDTSLYRIVVTSGQNGPNSSVEAENREYLDRKVVGKGRSLYKPAGGMFDLWRDAGFSGGRKALSPAPLRGFASAAGAASGAHDVHGTYGRVLRIVEALIRRAEGLSGRAENVELAVLGAVLSTDAFELNGYMTPTTSINALVLKHRFEVEVECQFSGVEYHFEIDRRLAEIKSRCNEISKFFSKNILNVASLNSEMRVIHALLMVLRSHGQFDEEQVCLDRIRVIHLNLWCSRSVINYVVWLPLRYVILLLQSPLHFAIAIIVWVVGIAEYLHWVGSPVGYSFLASLGDSASAFFSLGAPVENPESASKPALAGWPYVVGVYAAILAGFVHLGAFVSYVYSIVSRR